jgi:hypothetical protein
VLSEGIPIEGEHRPVRFAIDSFPCLIRLLVNWEVLYENFVFHFSSKERTESPPFFFEIAK